MRPAIPDLQSMADAFAVEQVAEMAVVVQEGIFGPDRQDDIHPAQMAEPPIAGKVRQEVGRRIEVNRVAVVPAQ
jgi:hypothetical protein